MLTGILAAELRVKKAVKPRISQTTENQWVWIFTHEDKRNKWLTTKATKTLFQQGLKSRNNSLLKSNPIV